MLYGSTDLADGFAPNAPPIDVNGTLYGTTYEGGGPKGSGAAVIFVLSP